jgi:hypothetical protein
VLFFCFPSGGINKIFRRLYQRERKKSIIPAVAEKEHKSRQSFIYGIFSNYSVRRVLPAGFSHYDMGKGKRNYERCMAANFRLKAILILQN